MPAEATQEVRMLLNRLDSEVVNLLYMAGARDKLSQLGERDSSPVTTVPDRRREGVQCAECGRNVISVSVGRVALDDGLRLESPSDIFVAMLCGIEGAGEGNPPLALELVATLEHWSRGECDLRYWRWGSERGLRWREELS